MDPVDVTAPVKVRTPEVEVTVAVPPMVEAPFTVKSVDAEDSVPTAKVTSVPEMVELATKVAVPAVFVESKLL